MEICQNPILIDGIWDFVSCILFICSMEEYTKYQIVVVQMVSSADPWWLKILISESAGVGGGSGFLLPLCTVRWSSSVLVQWFLDGAWTAVNQFVIDS